MFQGDKPKKCFCRLRLNNNQRTMQSDEDILNHIVRVRPAPDAGIFPQHSLGHQT